MMFLSIILVFIASAATQDEQEWCNTCLKVESTCYNVSFVFDLNATFRNHIIVHKMGVLRSENILFYSFEPPIEDKEYYKVAYVNLDDSEQDGIISDNNIPILNFGTFDIDQDNSIVYLGGSDGIFSWDKNRNLNQYSSRGDEIRTVFYKDFLFFTKSNDTNIIEKKGDQFEILEENLRVKNFVITKYNVIVFLAYNGLFLKKNGEKVLLSKNAYFRGMTIDLDGTVYVWWVDGIYKVIIAEHLDKSHVIKVATLTSIGAMTFDNDNNILFNSGRGLYKMTKTSNMTACTDESNLL